ncbi:MAG: hypothetical protein WCG01_05565 [bacterium]
MTTKLLRLQKLLPIFLFIEVLSFAAWHFPVLNQILFGVIFISALYLSLQKIEYGLALIFAELLIGSKGYLFWLTIGNFRLSIRIGLFLAVIIAWKYGVICDYFREKKLDTLINALKIPSQNLFLALLLFCALGVINGLVMNNGLKAVFFDMNAWLYFFLLWPLNAFYGRATLNEKRQFLNILFAAAVWLMIKTWMLLYIFSHEFLMVEDIYHWVRDTGVGEITAMKAGFYRIFIQSHIYSLFVLLILFIKILNNIKDETFKKLIKSKNYWHLIFLASAFFSVILIGLSRSFWLALIVGMLSIVTLWYALHIKTFSFKIQLANVFQLMASCIMVLIASLVIILVIIKFPYPKNLADFNAGSVLSDRATETNESAIGSRWSLLPELFKAIIKNPLIGSGFGKTVVYKSSDPRVLATDKSGTYTTYAFEWGWLDVWLKIGLLGLVTYGWLVIAQIARIYSSRSLLESTTGITLIALLITLMAVHVFTPYLNHPLGIGFIILVLVMVRDDRDLPLLLK